MSVLSCLVNSISPITEKDKSIQFIEEIKKCEHLFYEETSALKDAIGNANTDLLFFDVGIMALFHKGVNNPDARREIIDACGISNLAFGYWHHRKLSQGTMFRLWRENIREALLQLDDNEINRKRRELVTKVNQCYMNICEHLNIECKLDYLSDDTETYRLALTDIVNNMMDPTKTYVTGWMKAIIKVIETTEKDKVELIYDLDELVFTKAIVDDKMVYSVTLNEELRCVFDNNCVLLEGNIPTFKRLVAEMNIFYTKNLKR